MTANYDGCSAVFVKDMAYFIPKERLSKYMKLGKESSESNTITLESLRKNRKKIPSWNCVSCTIVLAAWEEKSLLLMQMIS